VAPRFTVDSAGCSDTTVGGTACTLTWLDAEDPFRLAVMEALPGAIPLTGTAALTLPAGTVTPAATDATVGLSLASATSTFADCAAEIETVSVPLAPCVTESDPGVRL